MSDILRHTPSVLLQTLVVVLRGDNKKLKIRAIIDSASQRSYILDSTAKKVGYKSIRKEKLKHSLFGGSSTNTCEHNVYKAYLSDVGNNYRCNFDVLNQPTICQTMPPVTQQLCGDDLSSAGIYLEDSLGPIELLIGADVAGKLMTGRLKRLKSGLTAVETKLGWTVLGRTTRHSEQTENLVVASMLTRDVRITDLWELDSLGIKDPAENQSKEELEKASETHFVKTLSQDSDGRYSVSLPWIEGHQILPNNKIVAERRLKSTVKALRNKGLIEDYEEVFNQWLDEQIIEEVKPDELEKTSCHYLPHRAVIKEHSTTNIRPVFDASAKEKGNVSLNDCLAKGPNYIELIPSILNRFRSKKYGIISDIRKAFLQIGINEADCDFLRFLWWEGGDTNRMKVFRHRRVVFGVNSSPFLLGATLNYHLSNVPDYLQETASKLKKSMYVDNCVTSCDSEEEVVNFIEQSKEIMSSGCFDLRGWIGNGLQPETFGIPEETFREETVSVLGLNWNILEDTLYSEPKFDDYEDANLSKRIILSLASRIFDPIGFLSPVTLIPKFLMQECWRRKLAWDARLPSDLEKKFLRWKNELKILKEIRIPRRIFQNYDLDTNLSFHVFCDASQHAYATCIYLREENDFGVKCQLVQARARVAPLKSVSIPRLELLACCLGARLMDSIKKDFSYDRVQIFYWTDSMNAMFWIKNQENWATFVLNRVREIRNISDPTAWNHIPGKFNPADFPSRGCYPKELERSKWWLGPKWIYQPPEEWPITSELMSDPEIVNAERRKTVITASNVIPLNSEDLFASISSYDKILRVVGWIYRFKKNAPLDPSRRKRGGITLEEIKHAEMIICKFIQKQSFKGTDDKTIRGLQPTNDSNGVIRIKTRIMKREDNEDFKLPILLPSDHPLVWKLIRAEHEKMGHAGTQFLMCRLREKFWILKSRRTIRKVIRNCVHCRRFDAPAGEVPQSTLPEDRIREAKGFEIVGVDLTGPLFLKGKRKVWITLFTCAVYRAVHLELTSSLSTEAFLQAFRRFVSRRGRPAIVYSDNGTNFVGTDNLFKSIDWTKVATVAVDQKIDWKFIPPSSPWWGGWWERLIGVMKRILRKVLGRSSLDYESLHTVLCDVEATMNGRPLTYLSEDVSDLTALTPAMFLHDLPMSGVPDLDYVDSASLKRSLIYQSKLRNDLRNRFRIEYLGQLRQNSKYIKDPTTLKVGDMVLVSTKRKRVSWPLARISEVIPSADGHVRLVKVRTSDSELVRTVQQLIPLESDFCYQSDFVRRLRSSKAD